MSDFVARHGLWTQAQTDAAAEVAERIAKLGVVRFAFSDAHGVVRGKTLIADEAARALRAGVTCTVTMLLKDLSGRTAFPIFEPGGDGAGDMVMVADPTTFRVLPWAPHSGWILCDLYRTNGDTAPILDAHADAPHAGATRQSAASPGARGWKWNSICSSATTTSLRRIISRCQARRRRSRR